MVHMSSEQRYQIHLSISPVTVSSIQRKVVTTRKTLLRQMSARFQNDNSISDNEGRVIAPARIQANHHHRSVCLLCSADRRMVVVLADLFKRYKATFRTMAILPCNEEGDLSTLIRSRLVHFLMEINQGSIQRPSNEDNRWISKSNDEM